MRKPTVTNADIDVYYSRYIQENSILGDHSALAEDGSDFYSVLKHGKPAAWYIPATDNILLSENWTDISVAGNPNQNAFA